MSQSTAENQCKTRYLYPRKSVSREAQVGTPRRGVRSAQRADPTKADWAPYTFLRRFPLASRVNTREDSTVLFMVNRLRQMMRSRAPRLGVLALVFMVWCLAATSARAAASMRAALDRNTIGLGESANLIITIEGGTLQTQLALPSIPGLQYGESSTEHGNLLEGTRYSSKTTITVVMNPTRLGSFDIPAIQAKVDGAVLTTLPLHLNVTKANLPDSTPNTQGVFVRLEVPTTNLYAGEVIPLDIKCYCQDANIQVPELTSDAFIIGNSTQFKQGPQVKIRGTQYNFLSMTSQITPTKTGRLTLGPAVWKITVVTARTFFGANGYPLTVNSDTLQFQVLPLPTNNVPASFTGAVGQFSLAQFEVAPATVAVGDPITLKVRISGKGSFDSVRLPADQTGFRDFKTYPASSKFDSSDPLQIEGSKSFEQVITPENVGIKEIPAFAFSYFDPESKSYRTITHPPIPLTVQPSAATPLPTVVSATPAAGSQPPAQEIVNIKEWLGPIATAGPPLLQRPGFLMWQGFAPLAFIYAWFWRRQKDNLANNPRLRRQREVARLVQQGLAELSTHAAANDAENFYATVIRLLQEQLGERLDLPASAITEAVLDDARSKEIDEPTETLLRELFHACNQFRYTPEHTAQELASLIPKVKTALEALQRLTPTATASGRNKLAQGVAVFLVFAGVASAYAQTPTQQFDQANTFYNEEDYPAAAAAYEKMTQTGPISAALYFNLGNAWFKSGHPGRAIAAYRRAEELAPRDADIRANLAFARSQSGTGAPAIPGNLGTRWAGHLTIDEWAKITSLFVGFFFLVLTARQIWPQCKKSTATLAAGLGVVSVWWIACLGLAWSLRFGQPSSVVIVPEAVVRNGPLEVSPSAFVVHDGAELLVLDRKNDWLEVADAAQHKGWVEKKDVALVP
jgi:tetratricopeptide (TPR) repeat protein